MNIKFIEALKKFKEAALELGEVWDEEENGNSGSEDYPFDDIYFAKKVKIATWCNAQIDIYEEEHIGEVNKEQCKLDLIDTSKTYELLLLDKRIKK